MKNNKEQVKSKLVVTIIGVLVAIYALAYLGIIIVAYLESSLSLLLLFGLIPLIILIGIIIVVRERFQEITDNEIEQAKKY